jgi:hypothetical protein
MTNRCAGVYAFTRRARVRPKPRLYSEFLKSGGGIESVRFAGKEDPFSFVAEVMRAFGSITQALRSG